MVANDPSPDWEKFPFFLKIWNGGLPLRAHSCNMHYELLTFKFLHITIWPVFLVWLLGRNKWVHFITCTLSITTVWLYVLVGGWVHSITRFHYSRCAQRGGGGRRLWILPLGDLIFFCEQETYWSMILGVYQKNCCCLCYWFLLAYGYNNYDHMSTSELSVKSEMMFERLNSFFKPTIHSYSCFTYYLRPAAFGLNKRQINLMLFVQWQIPSFASTSTRYYSLQQRNRLFKEMK